jgi:DNA-binding beta-propeller fold protein YncE
VAITPNGQTLLSTHLGPTVSIFTAPFSASSTPVTLSPPGGSQMDGITVTPNGQQAVIADFGAGGQIVVINAPFNGSSSSSIIPLSGVGGLEDISVSADGNFILATGGSGSPAPLVRAPFGPTSTVCNVPITGGRGAGSVRFLPVTLQPPVGPTVALVVPTLNPYVLVLLMLGLAGVAGFALRRR